MVKYLADIGRNARRTQKERMRNARKAVKNDFNQRESREGSYPLDPAKAPPQLPAPTYTQGNFDRVKPSS